MVCFCVLFIEVAKSGSNAATRSHWQPFEWPQVAASGREWPQVAATGHEWPHVAARDPQSMWLQVTASGQQVPASGRKWPQVTASGRKWPQVAASGRKWPQVAERLQIPVPIAAPFKT